MYKKKLRRRARITHNEEVIRIRRIKLKEFRKRENRHIKWESIVDREECYRKREVSGSREFILVSTSQ
jgi:hypothetical protein